MTKTSRVVNIAILTTALTAFAAPGLALAADAPAAPAAETPEAPSADIIVTGTRAVGQQAAQSATPIQLLSSDALTHVGQPNLNQALTQIVPSFQAQQQGTDMASFSLSARLRGVSPNHTLLMVNGKRRHGNSILQVINGAFGGSAAPSLDLIPPDIVSRLEILQDGAAAQYGSDAIAGVINIILKHDTSGATIKANVGSYYDGEGFTRSLSGNLGYSIGDSGFLDIALFHRRNDYTTLGTGQTSVTNVNGTPNTSVSALFQPIYAGLTANNSLSHITGGQPKSDLDVAFFNAGYDFGEIQLYAFGDVSYRDGKALQGYRPPNRICPSSAALAANPANCFAPTISAGMVPIIEVKQNEFSLTGGAKGKLAGWDWDASTTYASDHAEVYTENSANLTLFRNTGNTPRDFHDGGFKFTQLTSTLDVRKEFDVGLAGPLTFAFGGELRHEVYQIFAGDALSTYFEGGQSFPGYLPSDATKKKRNARSVYVDVTTKPVDGLLVELAGRYEHYSDFGSTQIGKITARYDFTPEIAVRATASTGFRAPSMPEVSYSATNVAPTSATVQLAPGSAGSLAAGFGALKPEKSVNVSAGFVFRPVPRLVVTLDGYYIKIKDRIVSSGTITGKRNGIDVLTPLINGLTPAALVSAAIAASGKAIDPTVGTLSIQTFTNGIDTTTKGIELSARYPITTDFGKFDLSLGLNYNDTKVVNNKLGTLFNAQAQAIIESASPKTKIVAGVNYEYGPFTTTLRATYYGKTISLVSPAVASNSPIVGNFWPVEVPSSVIVDLELSLDATKWLNLAVGANNLFNTTPPIPRTLLASEVVSGVVPSNGTSPYINGQTGIGAPYTFGPYGTKGGYYYGRVTVKF
ncbi:MAG: TonB-dependent receptor [Sphingomonadales bacterium]|nr:TonB-dependent receptor [Sphingomonadales bacterium]